MTTTKTGVNKHQSDFMEALAEMEVLDTKLALEPSNQKEIQRLLDKLCAAAVDGAKPAPQPVERSADIAEALNRMKAILVQPNAKGLFSNDFVMCVERAITALEAQPKAPASPLSNHEVTGCSGGADYVDGFPRLVMLQQLEGGEVVTYHHEATLPKAPASAVECAREIKRFARPKWDDGLDIEFDHNKAATLITAHTASAVAEARERALEDALESIKYMSCTCCQRIRALKGKAAEGGV